VLPALDENRIGDGIKDATQEIPGIFLCIIHVLAPGRVRLRTNWRWCASAPYMAVLAQREKGASLVDVPDVSFAVSR
jgi:hypothetical protein